MSISKFVSAEEYSRQSGIGVEEASDETGFCKTALSNAANGKSKTSYGYVWKYI